MSLAVRRPFVSASSGSARRRPDTQRSRKKPGHVLLAIAAGFAAAFGGVPADAATSARFGASASASASAENGYDRLFRAKALPRSNRFAPRVFVRRKTEIGAAYSIENLSFYAGDDDSLPMGIDNSGRVLIYDDTPNGEGPSTSSFVVVPGARPIGLPCICAGSITNDAVGYAISANTGEVAGYFDYGLAGKGIFKSNIVWGLEPTSAFIDYFDGYRKGDYALAVNDAGLSVGEDFAPTGSAAVIFSKMRGAARKDLLPLAGAVDCTSVATGINNAGTVIGTSCNTAVIFSRTTYAKPINVVGQSSAAAINGLGHIVGSARHSAFIYRAGHTTYLPRLTGAVSAYAAALNDDDEVVGSDTFPGPSFVAFAYIDGETYDLNAFLPAGSGWQLAQATGVNARGQIVGIGYYNGVKNAFLLTPAT